MPESTPDDTRALENRVLNRAAGGYLDAIAAIQKAHALGETPKVVEGIENLAPPKIGVEANKGVREAFNQGVTDTVAAVGQEGTGRGKGLARAVKSAGIPSSVTDGLAGLTEGARRAISTAAKLITGGANLDSAVAVLSANGLHVRRSVTFSVHAARNEAVIAACVREGELIVWEGERDGCVHCLRHSGEVSVDGTFPEGLTYGSKPLKRRADLPACPLHPECRCRLRRLGSQAYADGLRREANRSILLGYSLPSESEAARLDATERLLASGVDAPASVIRNAERAVKNGGYPDRTRPSRPR